MILTAEPSESWQFDRWEGDLQTSENPDTLIMDADKHITVVFESIEFTIDVTIEGEGTVIRNPDKEQYQSGENVTVVAEPAADWQFVRWEGDLESENNPETVVMEEDKALEVVFETKPVSHGYVEGVTPSNSPRLPREPIRQSRPAGKVPAEISDGWPEI